MDVYQYICGDQESRGQALSFVKSQGYNPRDWNGVAGALRDYVNKNGDAGLEVIKDLHPDGILFDNPRYDSYPGTYPANGVKGCGCNCGGMYNAAGNGVTPAVSEPKENRFLKISQGEAIIIGLAAIVAISLLTKK